MSGFHSTFPTGPLFLLSLANARLQVCVPGRRSEGVGAEGARQSVRVGGESRASPLGPYGMFTPDLCWVNSDWCG